MDLTPVKLNKEDILKQLDFSSYETIDSTFYMLIEMRKIFKNSDIPITLHISLQENHPKAEVFQEYLEAHGYNELLNQN